MEDYYTQGDYPPTSLRYSDEYITSNQANNLQGTIQSNFRQPVQNGMIPLPQNGNNGGVPMSPVTPTTDINQYKYRGETFRIDFKEILKRAIKYLIEGLAVAFVAYYFIGKGKLNIKDIVYLGITAAFVFAILDTFSPTISLGARFGAGFGIGQGLFGLNPTLIAPII